MLEFLWHHTSPNRLVRWRLGLCRILCRRRCFPSAAPDHSILTCAFQDRCKTHGNHEGGAEEGVVEPGVTTYGQRDALNA